MIRIAVLTEVFPKLSETFVVQLALECQRRGCDIQIYALRRGDREGFTPELRASGLLDRVTYLDVPANRNVRMLCAPTAIYRLLRARRNPIDLLRFRRHSRAVFSLRGLIAAGVLARACGRHTFDIIHAHFGKNGLLALQLNDAGLLTGAIVTTFHGQDATAYPRMLGDDVYRPLFCHGALVTTASGFIAHCLARLGARQEQIARLPMPFDSSRFRYRVRTPPSSGPVRLITVGRLVEKKGIGDVLDAVARLVYDHGVSIAYEVVGDGPLAQPLQARARELGIAHAVSFLGPLSPDDVRSAYERAHIFVLTSVTAADGDHEGLGVALLEAQASGLPVIATRHDGFPEAVVEDESAILVDEHSPAQLTDALLGLICTPGRWESMGRLGHKHVTETFARDVVGDRFMDILHTCARAYEQTHEQI
jgi:colanic acid/amylovoran biosynthesis glycosyltransferase